jgi:hypothetical protein
MVMAHVLGRIYQLDPMLAEAIQSGFEDAVDQIRKTAAKSRKRLTSQQAVEAVANARAIEVAAAPIVYVAALFGGTAEQAIKLLILLMVLTCDLLVIALTTAAARSAETRLNPSLLQPRAAGGAVLDGGNGT